MLNRFQTAATAVASQIEFEANKLASGLGYTITGEDDFTSRFADRVERAIDGQFINGVQFKAVLRKFTSAGASSEEKEYGADLAIVISAYGSGLDLSKGFLIQSKIAPTDFGKISSRKSLFPPSDRIWKQCDNMLNFTPEAYIWLYSDAGIHVARAMSFKGAGPSHLRDLNYHGPGRFFTMH